MRASTDPITNNVIIPAIDLSQYVGVLLKGKLPLSCLPVYLHEATHHWCFHSQVGSAVALLYLRARRALRLGADLSLPPEGECDPFEDYARYRIFDTLYRPLSEGLACFGEFDTLPAPNQVGTIVMQSAVRLFFRRGRRSDPEELAESQRISEKLERGEQLTTEEISSMFESIVGMLAECRCDLDWIDRKSNVIGRPFTLEDGGYVLGYLMVKLLYTCAASQEAHLGTDAYLTYLRWFFYEDEELVNLLFSTGTRDMSTVPCLIEHFTRRVTEFLTMDHCAGYRRFTAWLESPQIRTRLLEDALKTLLNRSDPPASPVDVDAVDLDTITLARREYLCITRAELEVRVSDGGTVRFIRPNASADSPPLLTIHRVSKLSPGTYQGLVEFQISTRDHVMVCVISVADEEPLVNVITTATDQRLREVETLWTRARHYDRILSKRRDLLEELSQDSIVETCVTRCSQTAAQLYRHVVMHLFDHRMKKELEPRLIEKGLLAVLSPSQIELIASCSMVPTATTPSLQAIVIETMGSTEADLRGAYDRLAPLLSADDAADEWRQFLLCL